MAPLVILGVGATLLLAAVGVLALALERPRVALQLVLAQRCALLAPRIVVLGDSLAAGCSFRGLRPRPFAVLSLARGGATLKEIAGQALQARDLPAEWIVIDGGLNDLLTDDASAEQMAADFNALLRRLPQQGKCVFLLPPFIADAAFAPRIAEANARLAALCAGTNVAVLDLNPELAAHGARLPTMMTDDGLHFSHAANAVWLGALRRMMG